MRNLVQYPIDKGEVHLMLDYLLRAERESKNIGGTNGVITSYIKEFLELNENEFVEFLKTKEVKYE